MRFDEGELLAWSRRPVDGPTVRRVVVEKVSTQPRTKKAVPTPKVNAKTKVVNWD